MDHYAEIDMDNLEGQCAKLPSQMVHAGVAYADAEFTYAKLRLNLKQVEAQLYNTHRVALEAGGKRTTEASITSAITLDPSFVSAAQQVTQAEVDVAKAKGLIEALRAKKDMLVSICAGRRAEAQTWK